MCWAVHLLDPVITDRHFTGMAMDTDTAAQEAAILDMVTRGMEPQGTADQEDTLINMRRSCSGYRAAPFLFVRIKFGCGTEAGGS